MLTEHIHRDLADIHDEFDRHSRITNTDYSIDADYKYLQGYTLLKCPDFDGFIRHITNYVKNKPVEFKVNGSPVDYDKIESLPRRRNNLVTFAVSPIQEKKMEKKEKKKKSELEPMGENQYKFADTKHARRQNPRINSKNKHQRSAFDESAFDDRLRESLSETVAFAEPEVLFTKTTHIVSPQEDDIELEDIKEDCNQRIRQYLGVIESSSNETIIDLAEDIISDLTKKVNIIDGMLDARTT